MTQTSTNIQLTADQKKAADAFFNFLLSDANTFVLSGGAGVGKTFLMKYLSNDLMLTYERSCAIMGIEPTAYEIHYTATTNKAAEVLEHAVNQEVRTIHSFLGLRVFDDYKTGKQVIGETKQSRTYKNIILFVDESSMIDAPLHKQILNRVKGSKIVFVGDKAQLAPVNEDLSKVYKEVDADNFIHMTQSVRNADSPALMHLCAQLRHTVQTGEFHPIVEVPGSVEYLNDQQMQDKLQAHFYCPNDTARILCYTNSRVDAYNDYIREIRNLPREFIVGDVLVVASTYARGKTILNVEREVEILSIEPETYKAGYADLTPDQEEIEYRVMKIQAKASFMQEMEVQVPVSMEHVKAAIQKAKRQKDWGRYFELKNNFADLRGKEACTVYKSQGSTYDTVFVDLGNIGISRDPEQVARMLFVAASRATTKVYLYGQLPGKYQGNSHYDPNSDTSAIAAE